MKLRPVRLADMPRRGANQRKESMAMYRRVVEAFERSGHDAVEVLELGPRPVNRVYKGIYGIAYRTAPNVQVRYAQGRIFLVRRDRLETFDRMRAGKE